MFHDTSDVFVIRHVDRALSITALGLLLFKYNLRLRVMACSSIGGSKT